MLDSVVYRSVEYNCAKELKSIKDQIDKLSDNIPEMSEDTVTHSEYVCRIHVHFRVFDWSKPPNKSNGSSGTGTGFVLKNVTAENDDVYIITAHHVVSNAIQIIVNFNKVSSEDIRADMVGCNPEMDIAVLKVSHPFLKERLDGFEIGDSDRLKSLEKVKAMGYALGKTHLQTTAGVVSGRISNPSRLQIDVAVNPGNSGGPLLSLDNQVVGLVTSGITDAQGINYAAPIHETLVMVRRILASNVKIPSSLSAHGAVFDMLPKLNCSFTKSNQVILGQIPNNASKNGIYCTSVHPLIEYPQSITNALENLSRSSHPLIKEAQDFIKSVNIDDDMSKHTWQMLLLQKFNLSDCNVLLDLLKNDTLQKGDIVCKMTINEETFDIDIHMNCNFNQPNSKYNFWPDHIAFTSILDRLSIGDIITFHAWRKGLSNLKPIDIELQDEKNVFREMYSDTEIIPYIAIGGMFVMPLLHNHIPIFKRNNMVSLMNTPHGPHKSLVVITHVLPESPFNESETVGVGDVIVALNNTRIHSLKSLSKAWKSEIEKGNAITLHMRDGSLTTATTESINEWESIIIKEYSNQKFVKHDI